MGAIVSNASNTSNALERVGSRTVLLTHLVKPAGRVYRLQKALPRWQMYRFPSTLYLQEVLNDLVGAVPSPWQAEVRLGLQEALVNAVKHGNGLDEEKWITVRSRHEVRPDGHHSWWAIADAGVSGTKSAALDRAMTTAAQPCAAEAECGRGVFILRQLFQEVHWDGERHQLSLYKYMGRHTPPILV